MARESVPPPLTSQDQELNQRNSIPKSFKTELIAATPEDRKRAEMLIKVYAILAAGPSIEEVRKYVADDYVQHSPLLPDGPEGLVSFFSSTKIEYPLEIDVHKVMVVGDWAMAHVNFRNMITTAPNDLGMAAVDIYTFGPDGKLTEHWDAVQGIPTHSVNPNGMLVRVRKD